MNYRQYVGLECTTPCSMYSVLLQHKLIEDPFYGLNEKKYTDYSRFPCSFSSEFELNERAVNKKNLLLRLSGLDTLCSIYLNDVLIAEVENMHRTYTFDIKGAALCGKNVLRIDIKPPFDEIDRRQAEHPLATDGNCYPGVSHLRKAFFSFGWDWAPTLPDMGILGEVEVIAFDKKIIEGVRVRQMHSADDVTLELTLDTLGEDDMSRAVATLVSPAGNVYYGGFSNGKSVIKVHKPDLWWPNGLGVPNLYKLSVNLYSESEIKDSREMRIGLRTLTVSREKDEYGEEFALTVNGVRFFAMGANYVPEDSIIPRTNKERTKRILRDCKNANFNCVRVWGGAYYPPDYFYDLCDEYGLVVWQDFMIACCTAYMSERLSAEFAAEFTDNFKRIAHHPSLGIISGNNEMEQAVCEWGVFKGLSFDGEDIRRDYLALYETLLPKLAKQIVPDTFYWPASPSSGGNFDDPNAFDRGDCHYWDMWVPGVPFEECRAHFPRFCSEYGYESLPNIKTVKSFTEPDDRNMYSPVMELHQKKPGGTLMITGYASRRYRYPESIEEVVYVSQLMQMDAVRCLVEHMRSNRGRCMGSIYWQLNDCWPVSSWASLDYFGRWKALHYGAKRVYAPILVSAREDGTRVTFNLSCERLDGFDGEFWYAVLDRDNNVLFKDSFKISSEPMCAHDIHSCDIGGIVKGREDECYVAYGVKDGKSQSRGTLMLVTPKRFRFARPTIKATVSGSGTAYVLTLSSDVFAKSVELDFKNIDAVFEDNYFDITDHNPIRVSFTTKAVTNAETLERELCIRSVYDVGRSRV